MSLPLTQSQLERLGTIFNRYTQREWFVNMNTSGDVVVALLEEDPEISWRSPDPSPAVRLGQPQAGRSFTLE